jgi:hypothetical protein
MEKSIIDVALTLIILQTKKKNIRKKKMMMIGTGIKTINKN